MELSQLRQDLVSGDWILIAPGRKDRPHQFKNKEKRKKAPVNGCPFENPQMMNHAEPILQFNNEKGWTLQIIENKFPAFTHRDVCSTIANVGPYSVTDGVGHHDLAITKDHNKNFSALAENSAFDVFKAFQDRYLMLIHDQCLACASIFHNWGPKAGASIYHPHYQMIAVPVVPPDVEHSFRGSKNYFEKHKRCVHCDMIAWERQKKTRVVFENKEAVAVAPFVSRNAFEVRIFSKKHLPYFENTGEIELAGVVAALKQSLELIKKSLGDPDYNFFIHTSPIKNKNHYGHYHWHIEVLPKLNIWAGFELGTGIEINPVDPDEAAALLRGKK